MINANLLFVELFDLQNLAERGENLSQLEDRTEKMMSEAESFQSAARQLATKFKDKKWYQF